MPRRPVAITVLAVLAIVLLSFAIAGRHTEAWISELLTHAAGRTAPTAAIIVGALAADALLPIPSSMLATGAGYLLGFTRGALTSFAGLMAGSLIGYAAGRFALPSVVSTGDVDRRVSGRAADPGLRRGDWIVAITRPVPVLAESATLLAGSCRFPLRRFLAVSALSNLCVAIVYAAAGALSASWRAPALALLAACGLPAAALLLAGRQSRSTASAAVPIAVPANPAMTSDPGHRDRPEMGKNDPCGSRGRLLL